MIIKFRCFILAIMLPLLVACVSVNNNMQLVSNSFAAISDVHACEPAPVMNQVINNSQGLNPDSIAFLNWNIYKGQGENWEKDLSYFSQSHDLMTIQEAVLDDDLTGLLKMHDFNWIMNTAFYLNGTAAGVMTVANSNAIQSCGFKDIEPLIRIPKSTLVSYYAINGSDKNLLVANIHGINFTLGIEAYRQQLETLYDSIKHHDGPMIVAGDFNSWSSDRIIEVDQLTKRLSLSALDYPVNNKTHVFGEAIDHVFYRHLEPINNQVWQVSSSDHNPISVVFKHRSTS